MKKKIKFESTAMLLHLYKYLYANKEKLHLLYAIETSMISHSYDQALKILNMENNYALKCKCFF